MSTDALKTPVGKSYWLAEEIEELHTSHQFAFCQPDVEGLTFGQFMCRQPLVLLRLIIQPMYQVLHSPSLPMFVQNLIHKIFFLFTHKNQRWFLQFMTRKQTFIVLHKLPNLRCMECWEHVQMVRQFNGDCG
jgi:hypothetical protein